MKLRSIYLSLRAREEETGLTCDSIALIAKKYHSTSIEDQTVHYYLCNDCEGEVVCNEAEDLFWISLDEAELIDYEIEREAVTELQEYLLLRNVR